MSIESEFARFQGLNRTLGKAAVNTLFPDDFEVYIIALELVNGDGDTEDYFVFPINPNSINEKQSPIISFKKTAGGITVMSTTTFSPTDITLQGNFGRKFKFLIGSELINFAALRFNPSIQNATQEFNKHIKTGYGCYKVLENIIKKSNTLDSKGQPYGLFFYNLALGNSYLVKHTSIDPYQSQDTNMIWSYNLTMKSLIKVEDIVNKSKKSIVASLNINSAVQGTVNVVGNKIAQLINNPNSTFTTDSIKSDIARNT